MDHHSPPRNVRFQFLNKENVVETPRTPAPPPQPSSTKTPVPHPSGSKLLRKHFSQISLTTPRRRRRLLEGGAVRIASSVQKQQPQQRHHSPKRIGYDGTAHTPSKQLMRSTVASRNHQIVHNQNEADMFVQQLEERLFEPYHRNDFDPVASILLQEQDGCGGSVQGDSCCSTLHDDEHHPKDVTGDLQNFSGVVRPVATKLQHYR